MLYLQEIKVKKRSPSSSRSLRKWEGGCTSTKQEWLHAQAIRTIVQQSCRDRIDGERVSSSSLLTRRPVTARCNRNLEPPWEIPKGRTGNMQSLTRSLFLINTSAVAQFIGQSIHFCARAISSGWDSGTPVPSCYMRGEARTCPGKAACDS